MYDMHLSSSSGSSGPELLVSIKTAARFASVDWSSYTGGSSSSSSSSNTATHPYPLGLIAGGMTDGTIHVWDVNALVHKTSLRPIYSLNEHANGPVAALKFNPLVPSQLATGGVHGHVLVVDFENVGPGHPPVVTDPTAGSRQSAKITAAAWNSQVSHILATSSGDGSVAVWDLKQRKAWCKLQVEHGPVSDILWNPTEGLYLLTASGDDRNPVIKVWDLGASTSMPLTTMPGHTAGILRTAWCPHDDTILLTCAKDNRSLLWDLVTLQPFTELPVDTAGDDGASGMAAASAAAPSAANQLFASKSLAEQKHMRVDAAWSPLKRGLVLTCSLDRKVQVHSVLGLATQSGRPPKWMKPMSSVSTAFGGAVIFVGASTTTALDGTPREKIVTIQTIQEQPFLAKLAVNFEEQVASSPSMVEFCDSRRARAKQGSVEEKTWGMMRVMFQAASAREHLLEHLGLHADEIAAAAAAASSSQDATTNGVASLSLSSDKTAAGGGMSKSAEDIVKKALLVGNFEAAVECCFQSGNLSDALLLASCGGQDLLSMAQERYFELESAKRPYLSLVNNIVKNQLAALVDQSDTSQWQETLAILATYAQSDEFPTLCIALGQRLEDAGDAENANLCFMCSLNVEQATRFWKTELEKSRKGKGPYNLVALHQMVVKVSMFMKAAGPNAVLPDDVAELFAKYATAVAEQGLFTIAAKYCVGNGPEIQILRDRLYRSRESQRCVVELGAVPDFPFSMTPVNQSRGMTTSARTSAQQQQQQANNTYAAQQQQQDYAQQVYAQQQAYAQPAPAADQLPPGWVALQDPTSGLTYYANEHTGETTWDRPAMAPVQSVSAPNSYSHAFARQETPDPIQSSSHSTSTPAKTPKAALVSKYGDGFVTSASHPELAYQYGNIGTSNPYHGVTRPGTAAAVLTSPKVEAPPSGPFDINELELAPEYVPIKDTLYALYDHLMTYATSSEKRQLEESKKGLDTLMKKLARGMLEEEIVVKVLEIVGSLSNHDFRTAASIQTGLVNDFWKLHKDWLKGLKTVLQMASKKLSG